MTTILEIGRGVKCINTPIEAKKKIEKDLTIENPKYKKAIKLGKYTNESPYVVLFDSEKSTYWFPRGYVFFLIKFLKKINHPYKIIEKTKTFNPLKFKFHGKLRDYQETSQKNILKYPIGVLEAGTGSGKTVVALSIIVERQQPTLILVHTKELLYQWKDRIKEFLKEDCGIIGDGKCIIKPITVGTIQTVKKKLDELTPKFGFLIVDECFVKGTLVDGKPIETLKIGDYVNSYNHKTKKIEKKKILNIFKKRLKGKLIQINTKNKKGPISTLNHPFYNPIKKEYLTASLFNDTQSVYYIDRQQINKGEKTNEKKNEKESIQRLSYMWKNHYFTKRRTELLTNLPCTIRNRKMFRKMLPKSQRNRTRKSWKIFNRIQQKVCQRKNEKIQPILQSKKHRKSQIYKEIKRYFKCLDWKTWGKWSINSTTRKTCNSIGMGNRSPNQNSRSFTYKTKKRMVHKKESTNLLQSRYRESKIKNSNRSRFQKSSNQETQKFRQKERIPIKVERVESVEIYQRRNRQQFRKVCPDNFVYNIEVEDNNNYFAENILVHNCHRYTTLANLFSVQDFPAKYYLGVTATPFRSDGLGKIIFTSLGPKIHIVNKKNLFDTKAILRPDVFRIDTNFRYIYTDDYSRMITELTNDDDRNQLICAKTSEDLDVYNDTILIVSERKKHIDILQEMLKTDYGIKSISLTGGTKKSKRNEYVESIRNKKFKVVLATISLIGEGFDLSHLTALMITTPIKFSGRVIQTVGRALRPNKEDKHKIPRIYDFRDNNVEILRYSGFGRDRIYRKEWS